MAQLTRKTFVQFGAAGPTSSFGQFGSKTAGSPQTSQNPTVIQQLAAWSDGWQNAIVNSDKAAYLEDMNGLCYVFSYMIAYLYQSGIPEWDSGTTYYLNSVVQANSGQWFNSLQNNNTGNAPPVGASNSFWAWINAPSADIGVLKEYAGITLPVFHLWADGTAISRTTYATLFNTICFSTSGTTSLGFPQITGIPSTADLKVGWFISGVGIPGGATILSVDNPNQVTMSANATSSNVSSTVVFAPWGAGDGTTTFNLPDTRRRVGVGMGGTGTVTLGSQLGAYGGEETHILTIAEMPAHFHASVGNASYVASGGVLAPNPSTAGNTGSTGGGGPHNIMQPSYVVTKIIKYA